MSQEFMLEFPLKSSNIKQLINMQYTEKSLRLTREISNKIKEQTFHHHYHILYDLVSSYKEEILVSYVEIGCYAGGSACLVLQRKNTEVISIDLGKPISPNIVKTNVDNLNIHNNTHVYLEGNSQTYEMVDKVKELTDSIDVLFIDGDHTYQGVVNDFMLYKDLVSKGGYIVFDDYNDHDHSPEVKHAVDDIVRSHPNLYNVIGTVDNILGARPDTLTEGNCFILQLI
jgi:predicted O-methyltransferase YrrM